MSKGIAKYLCNYEIFLILGDFNITMLDDNMKNFCETYDLKNLINEPTCYKNASNPSAIDVILTNRSKSFHNCISIATGQSDHYKMVLPVLKSYCKKIDPVISTYRDYNLVIMSLEVI